MKYDKETVYDEQIAPLMAQIIDICKREKVYFCAQFYLKQQHEESYVENDAMYFTSVLIPKKTEIFPEHHEHLSYVAGAMKNGKQGKPWVMTVTIKEGESHETNR